MKLNRLTARTVQTLTKTGRHADGGNLYLSISNGGRRWVMLYDFAGKRRELGLGSAGPGGVTLAEARTAAAAVRAKIAAGIDPVAEKRAAEAAAAKPARPSTFGEVAEEFIAGKEAGWRNAKHRQQWENTLKTYCTAIWSKPVAEVGVEDVLAILKPIWQAKPETASRVRGRIEAVLDAARVRGLRPHGAMNPAVWKNNLSALLPAAKKLSRGHHAAMPFEQVPAFVQQLRGLEAVSARALELLILTACRSGEVLGMEWSELNEDRTLWVIPADRMKGGRVHRVPLGDRCREIIAEVEPLRPTDKEGRPVGTFVFPGHKRGRPLSGMAMEMLLRRLKVEDATVHGFRSSFRDWCGECTLHPREVAEAALAHAVGDKVEAAYRRGDALAKRTALMSEWATYIEGVTTVAGNVVTLRPGAADNAATAA